MGLLNMFGSFESRTIQIAMEALQKTAGVIPDDSLEYFPPPAVMKATLKENFSSKRAQMSLKRDYGEVKAEAAAYHLLDYLGHLFAHNGKADMGAWCLAARDTLSRHVE